MPAAERILRGNILRFCHHYHGPKFHGVLCDPPYHLTSQDPRDHRRASPSKKQRTKIGGFMGQKWDGGDIAFRPETWAEIGSILLPGAHLLAFGGTRTFHRLTCAIEDAT